MTEYLLQIGGADFPARTYWLDRMCALAQKYDTFNEYYTPILLTQDKVRLAFAHTLLTVVRDHPDELNEAYTAEMTDLEKVNALIAFLQAGRIHGFAS